MDGEIHLNQHILDAIIQDVSTKLQEASKRPETSPGPSSGESAPHATAPWWALYASRGITPITGASAGLLQVGCSWPQVVFIQPVALALAEPGKSQVGCSWPQVVFIQPVALALAEPGKSEVGCSWPQDMFIQNKLAGSGTGSKDARLVPRGMQLSPVFSMICWQAVAQAARARA